MLNSRMDIVDFPMYWRKIPQLTFFGITILQIAILALEVLNGHVPPPTPLVTLVFAQDIDCQTVNSHLYMSLNQS